MVIHNLVSSPPKYQGNVQRKELYREGYQGWIPRKEGSQGRKETKEEYQGSRLESYQGRRGGCRERKDVEEEYQGRQEGRLPRKEGRMSREE